MSGEELAPTFANTGELTHHAPGCRCWPHVSEQDALDAIAAVGLAEYRDGRALLAAPSTEPALDAATHHAMAELVAWCVEEQPGGKYVCSFCDADLTPIGSWHEDDCYAGYLDLRYHLTLASTHHIARLAESQR